MADVAVLAQSPLAEQPDDTAHQVSHTVLQAFQPAKFLLVTPVYSHALPSQRQAGCCCCTCQSYIQLTLFVLTYKFRGN